MNDNENPDRSQAEGQEGIDRETERRNRENESGQQQQGGQSGEQSAEWTGGEQQGGQDRDSSALGQEGQSAGGDASLSERTGQTGGQSSTGETGSPGSENFFGAGKDDSSDYLTKGEQDPDFAPEGQGAQDTDAGRSDIETGQSQDRASGLDDTSDSDR